MPLHALRTRGLLSRLLHGGVAAAFALVTGMSAVHEVGCVHGHSHAEPPADVSADAHGEHAAHGSEDEHDPGSPEDCRCLGVCLGGAGVPTVAATSGLPHPDAFTGAGISPDGSAQPRPKPPYSLPYPNAPPAVSSPT